jgi:hypothetical protein
LTPSRLIVDAVSVAGARALVRRWTGGGAEGRMTG